MRKVQVHLSPSFLEWDAREPLKITREDEMPAELVFEDHGPFGVNAEWVYELSLGKDRFSIKSIPGKTEPQMFLMALPESFADVEMLKENGNVLGFTQLGEKSVVVCIVDVDFLAVLLEATTSVQEKELCV